MLHELLEISLTIRLPLPNHINQSVAILVVTSIDDDILLRDGSQVTKAGDLELNDVLFILGLLLLCKVMISFELGDYCIFFRHLTFFLLQHQTLNLIK